MHTTLLLIVFAFVRVHRSYQNCEQKLVGLIGPVKRNEKHDRMNDIIGH